MSTTRTVKLFSPLDPIALATKLKDEMEKREKHKGFHVFGGGTEEEITLLYGRPDILTGIEPTLRGTMRAHDGGTLIEAKATKRGNPKIFFVIWFLFLIPFVAIGIGSWFFDGPPLMFKILFTGVPAIMLGAGILMLRRSLEKKPEEFGTIYHIFDFLEETVDARPLSRY